MKKQIFLALMAFSTSIAYAQENESVKATHFLLEKFTPGIAHFKDGQEVAAVFNYSILNGKLLYYENGEILFAGDQAKIDRVTLGETVLVPYGDGFIQALREGENGLYFHRFGAVIPADKKDPYGGTIPASSSSQIISYSDFSRVPFIPSDYTVKLTDKYFLNRDGKMIPFSTLKDAQKAFPDKAVALKEFVKKNNIKFKTNSDMLSVLDFCLGQAK